MNSMDRGYDDQFPRWYTYVGLFYGVAFLFLILYAWPRIGNTLGVNRQTAFFPSVRVFMTFFISLTLIPIAFMTELMYSRWRKRRFQVRYALVWVGLVVEAILVMNAAFLAFQFAFPNIFFSHVQSAALVASLMLFGTIVPVTVAATTRIPRVLEYIKKITQ